MHVRRVGGGIVPQPRHRLLQLQRVRHALGGIVDRNGGRAHNSLFIVADALNDVVPHKRAVIARARAVPLVARVKPLVDAVLLIQPARAKLSLVFRAVLVFSEHRLRQRPDLVRLLSGAFPLLTHRLPPPFRFAPTIIFCANSLAGVCSLPS